ncbi:hypothetical protein JHD50_02620 [Sulfurimonas sp. MAG313]|nr:hypothetical protein [Sulfurimonas sp. MAG313]MDF1880206.1 hypothetical protein [Sulfurimonas sp. MAG313]
MKIKLLSTLLIVTILIPMNANALFLKTMVQEMTSVANNVIDSSTQVSSEMLQLFGALADDIGEMADRILVMADKIGEMADRIVETEKIMATLATDIATIKSNQGVSAVISPSIFIQQDTFQTTLYNGEVPRFTLSNASNEYLLYVSSSATMDTNTISILVKSSYDLTTRWNSLQKLARNYKIYIAVKSINANNISSLSNVIEYSTTY